MSPSLPIRLRERRGTETRSLLIAPSFLDVEAPTAISQHFHHRTRRKGCGLRRVAVSVHSAKENLLKGIRQLSESVRSALVPAGVRDDYWRFMVWKNAQRCVASVMSTMATQVTPIGHRNWSIHLAVCSDVRCSVHPHRLQKLYSITMATQLEIAVE